MHVSYRTGMKQVIYDAVCHDGGCHVQGETVADAISK